MKYSVVSLAAFVLPSLGSPICYLEPYHLSHHPHIADAGDIVISNYAGFHIAVDEQPVGAQYDIEPGQQVTIPGTTVADLKFNNQAEVSYVSGDQGTFNYVIKPLSEDFAACVAVEPRGECGSARWCPGQGETDPVTCPEGTELPVTIYPKQSDTRKATYRNLYHQARVYL